MVFIVEMVYIVDMVYTVDKVYTVDAVYTTQTVSFCTPAFGLSPPLIFAFCTLAFRPTFSILDRCLSAFQRYLRKLANNHITIIRPSSAVN